MKVSCFLEAEEKQNVQNFTVGIKSSKFYLQVTTVAGLKASLSCDCNTFIYLKPLNTTCSTQEISIVKANKFHKIIPFKAWTWKYKLLEHSWYKVPISSVFLSCMKTCTAAGYVPFVLKAIGNKVSMKKRDSAFDSRLHKKFWKQTSNFYNTPMLKHYKSLSYFHDNNIYNLLSLRI